MKYGRHKIDKAGETITSSKNFDEVARSLEIVNDWRNLHLPALDALQAEVIPLFKKHHIDIYLSSRRLKRLTSIQYKLDINPEMHLGGMQDIGGLRIVVPNVESLMSAVSTLVNNTPKHFTLVKTMDYVSEPKPSGYRSIHFIYKYNDEDNPDTNGMKVELQVRTKLQHIWAMAVETAELITDTRLKSSFGADEWLNFFKIVSSLYAIKEELPILSEHKEQSFSMTDLLKILYQMNTEHKHGDALKALRVSIDIAKQEQYRNGYYLLNINFDTKTVKVAAYPKEQEEAASAQYAEEERAIIDNRNAVVLVSVPKMKELQEAYPSYFLDTSEFIEHLDTMMRNCELKNLVHANVPNVPVVPII